MLFLLSALIFVQPSMAGGIDQPECDRLETWAVGVNPDETILLAPKVEVSALLKDELTVPLFGSSALSWDANDLNTVRRALDQCRRAASKRKDKQASDQLYQAIKAFDRSRISLNQLQRVRTSVPHRVQRLIDYRSNPNLPAMLALAQDALKGEDIDLQSRGMQRPPTWLSSLQQAPEYLPPSEIDPLIARLAERQAALEEESREVKRELEDAKRQLSEVPISQQGLSTLDRLSRLPALEKLPPDEADAFRNAVQKKRWAIQSAMRQQQQQQAAARAAQPVPARSRIERLLIGDNLKNLSIQGLKCGMRYDQAKSLIEQNWRFKSGAGGDVMKDFSPTVRDLANYTEVERRDGGRFELETMNGQIGHIKFIENYTGPMNSGDAHAWLKDRFGEPEKVQRDAAGALGLWVDGGTYLEVFSGNRVIGPRSTLTYKSSIVIALWSQGYKDYPEEANKRCKKLRQKPVNALSTAERQAILFGCKTP
jgi:hypothetical protein